MNTRPTIVAVAVAVAAGLAVTGITYASASAYEPTQAAPASAPMGGDSGRGNEGRGDEGRGFGGRIHINERSYSADLGDCITVVSGLGSRSLLGGTLREYRHAA
jgi:hypothetical protein